jgi:hypothetical protein
VHLVGLYMCIHSIYRYMCVSYTYLYFLLLRLRDKIICLIRVAAQEGCETLY